MMNLFSGKIKSASAFVKNQFWQIDWKLLLFLLLFLNVKLYFKVIAIVFIYISHFNFKFGFRLRNSRLPLFYVAVIVISLINCIIYVLFKKLDYDIVFITGIFFWLLCILAIHQLKLSVDSIKPNILHNTLIAFFIINATFSFINLLGIIIETHALNPYQYQGLFQKYFIGTGDYIKGVFFDTSTTNAIINAFGAVYFLSRKNYRMVLVCMLVLLLTGSNSTNLLLLIALIYIFIFQSNRNQKSVFSVCLFMLILFLVKVSPQNNQYSITTVQRIFNKEDTSRRIVSVNLSDTGLQDMQLKIATAYIDSIKIKLEEQRQTAAALINISNPWKRPSLPKADINSPEYQYSNDTTQKQKELIEFSNLQNVDSFVSAINNNPKNLPGKLVAVKQTINFFFKNPAKIITGNGMGNFSSKLAFRATALKIAGGYPAKHQYINTDFIENHLALYLFYFIKRAGLHSVINTPDNTYDQLFSEYGMIGLISFLFFYIAFFLRHIKKQSYSIPLLLIISGVFFVGYWFEQLSVIVLFELLLLIDMKTSSSIIHFKKENE
jgi:hypothetical protein